MMSPERRRGTWAQRKSSFTRTDTFREIAAFTSPLAVCLLSFPTPFHGLAFPGLQPRIHYCHAVTRVSHKFKPYEGYGSKLPSPHPQSPRITPAVRLPLEVLHALTNPNAKTGAIRPTFKCSGVDSFNWPGSRTACEDARTLWGRAGPSTATLPDLLMRAAALGSEPRIQRAGVKPLTSIEGPEQVSVHRVSAFPDFHHRIHSSMLQSGPAYTILHPFLVVIELQFPSLPRLKTAATDVTQW